MQKYIGTKIINAQAMSRQEYNALRGWAVPADENQDDAGLIAIVFNATVYRKD
jgi:hypothetical protein